MERGLRGTTKMRNADMSVRAKKSLGQNFLMHARTAERIAKAAGLAPDATVLEIGPGTGMLTRELLKLAKKVVAVEADQELFEKLQAEFAQEIREGRLELVHADIRNYQKNTAIADTFGYEVVANIPYYLTGEIFRMFLTAPNQPSTMTLLVQKEVAERIARAKKESLFSLSVKAYGEPKYEFTVPRGAFRPAPKVDSAVISIRGISRRHFTDRAEEDCFFELIRAGFAHKRKFVSSNLAGIASEEALRAAGVSEGARAEDVPLTAWLALARSANA